MIVSFTALTDGELTLRPLERGDRDAMYAAVVESIAQVSPWLPWCHEGYGIAETESFIESCITAWAQQAHFPFAIFDARTGEYLGGTGVNHIERVNRIGCIGYWVRTSAAGRGIAPKAVRLVARFAFDTLQLSRLEIFARPENAPSRRVAEKSGAKFEAVARNRVVQHGKAYDAALYSLIPSDLAPPASRAG
ncbi:MAG: GNAT family N-acetyltransferase [Gammaproteobacteria bacterium]